MDLPSIKCLVITKKNYETSQVFLFLPILLKRASKTGDTHYTVSTSLSLINTQQSHEVPQNDQRPLKKHNETIQKKYQNQI